MIDTRNRRAGALFPGQPFRAGSLPAPDGSLNENDRRQVCGLYPLFAEVIYPIHATLTDTGYYSATLTDSTYYDAELTDE